MITIQGRGGTSWGVVLRVVIALVLALGVGVRAGLGLRCSQGSGNPPRCSIRVRGRGNSLEQQYDAARDEHHASEVVSHE